jgi:hypothetical protein
MRFKEIGSQQLEFARDIWELSKAKVAVTMGGNPACTVVHLFEKRTVFVGDATYLIMNEADDKPPRNTSQCRVLFGYANEQYMADQRIVRVLFPVNNPEFCNRHRKRNVTISSYALSAAERFLDLALLMSVGQVARAACLGIV